MLTYTHVIDFNDGRGAEIVRDALEALDDTILVSEPTRYYFGGPMREHYLTVVTRWTESYLDNWLWRMPDDRIDYIGVVEVDTQHADDELGLYGQPA